MELRYGLISADERVQEHPSVWTERLSRRRWGDRIPHVERRDDGSERWAVDGTVVPLGGVAGAAAAMADRATEPQRWEEVPPAVHDPSARLKAMDANGVDYAVLYPTVAGVGGETFGRLADPELEQACVRAYNDWIMEEWAAASPRFIPQCIVPLYPVEAAVGEVHRAVARGHRGVIYPASPMELRDVPHINGPEYELLWATCEELEVPLCIHAGSSLNSQFPAYAGFSRTLAAALSALTRPASLVFALVNLLLSRILLRHPRLQVVFAESALGWAAYLLEYADHQFDKDHLRQEGYELKPSEMFGRQCYLTGWYDWASLQTRGFIGVDNILWATNFPAANSTWPDTWRTIRQNFDGIPTGERERILWGNAARLYRL